MRNWKRLRAWVTLLPLLAVCACGSMHSHDELVAAASRTGSADGAGASSSVGGTAAAGGPAGATSGGSVGGGAATGTPGATGATGGATGGAATADPSAVAAQDPAQADAASPQCTGDEAPITIASVGHQSGVLGATIGSGPRAVSAWAAWINARGGVNCHQVRHLIVDDGSDPARHQALVQQMVEEEGVIAFVQQNAILTGPASVPYIERVQVPVIGTDAGEHFYESPMFFPQYFAGDTAIRGSVRAIMRFAKSQGMNTMAVISCVESTLCSGFTPGAQSLAAEEGVEVVYGGQVTIAAPDYTSQCQQAQQRGAQVFLVAVDANAVRRVVRSCESINYHPLYSAPSIAASNILLAEPGADGLVAGVGAIPWTQTDNPAVAEFLDAIAQYAPGLEPGADAMAGWTSAKLFELAAQNLPADPTAADVLAGLWAVRDNDLGGLTYPLTFTQGQTAPRVECWFTVQIQGGAWTSPDNGARACA